LTNLFETAIIYLNNVSKIPKKYFLVFKIVFILILVSLIPLTTYRLRQNLDSPSQEDTTIAMVLGAGIINNSLPTKVLEWRLESAIELYKSKKITKILVSGDNSSFDHNEPEVMQNFLLKNGVPLNDIIQDFGGRRTIDSCWRAKNVFKVKKLYLISQDFHLPRATFLCSGQNIGVIPTSAQKTTSGIEFNGFIREVPASWVALWEEFGNYEPEIKGNGKEKILN
jgi:SanA protein